MVTHCNQGHTYVFPGISRDEFAIGLVNFGEQNYNQSLRQNISIRGVALAAEHGIDTSHVRELMRTFQRGNGSICED